MTDHTFNRGIVAACCVLMAVMLGAAMGGLIDMRDPAQPDPSTTTTSTTTPVVDQFTYLPPPITAAATTTITAARAPSQIQVTEAVPPPFNPVTYVNGLEYRALVMDSAMEAYRVVATYYGWSSTVIEARSSFVFRIMANESAGCWNARRWTYFTAGKLCTEHKTGIHDDVGFGQITDVLRPLTCEKAGICSIADTVASPWNSMLALVVVLDELGKRPWCYNRNMHVRNGDCATWPG